MGISPNDFKLSSIIDIHGFQYIIQKQLDFINIELVVISKHQFLDYGTLYGNKVCGENMNQIYS